MQGVVIFEPKLKRKESPSCPSWNLLGYYTEAADADVFPIPRSLLRGQPDEGTMDFSNGMTNGAEPRLDLARMSN